MSLVCGSAAVTAAAVYFAWRALGRARARRAHALRRRVTYMLWVMAEQDDAARPAWAGHGHARYFS